MSNICPMSLAKKPGLVQATRLSCGGCVHLENQRLLGGLGPWGSPTSLAGSTSREQLLEPRRRRLSSFIHVLCSRVDLDDVATDAFPPLPLPHEKD